MVDPSETEPEAYAIFTVGSATRYIKRSWLTRRAASAELASLLWPYPAGHHWRRALEVRACKLTPADAARCERERLRQSGRAA